jgi:asparagine synthase (glutamine-hydrolysing)
MCGIFGYFTQKGGNNLQEKVRQALDITRYRGPDNSGSKVLAEGRILLGHNRLSILDLSVHGNQPMCDGEEMIWIVFNGEIYNFLEIRKELLGKGYSFKSRSDTEVIIQAYREYGTSCVKRFDGMFAFGIVDMQRRRIILARDICGEKPLFYYDDGQRFMFASELKQILVQDIRKEFIPDHVDWYFSLGHLPHDRTFFRHIKKLPPGHMLTFDWENHTTHLERFWSLPCFDQALPEEAVLEELDTLFKQSLKRRMISDVPLGAFLSGGIDSSLTAAYMRAINVAEIKTYSIAFEGSSMNETAYARIVADHLDTRHTEITVKPDIDDLLEQLSAKMDEPIYDNSLIPTFVLCRYVRPYVTVALSGDGGDEIFAGYTHYFAALRCLQVTRAMPRILHPAARLLGNLLPHGRFGKKTLLSIGRGMNECFTYPRQIFFNEERDRLVQLSANTSLPVTYKNELMKAHKGDFINKMCAADIGTTLPQILVKVDRASMFNSLEVRTPFLNKDIIDFAFKHVPGSMKIRGNTKKYILKKLLKKHLPADFPLERKQGFDIPADLLVKSGFLNRMESLSLPEFLNADYVRRLISCQKAGKGAYWHQLFSVFMFSRWYAQWAG